MHMCILLKLNILHYPPIQSSLLLELLWPSQSFKRHGVVYDSLFCAGVRV